MKFSSGFFVHLDNKLTSYLATKSNREKTHRTVGHEIHVAHLCLTPAIIYFFYVRQIEHAQNGLKRGKSTQVVTFARTCGRLSRLTKTNDRDWMKISLVAFGGNKLIGRFRLKHTKHDLDDGKVTRKSLR